VNISSDDKELRQSIRQLDSLLTQVLKTQAVAMFEQLRRVGEIDSKNQGASSWMKPLLHSINSIPTGIRNTG
jgi:phosphoenolpyruvate carboxylase